MSLLSVRIRKTRMGGLGIDKIKESVIAQNKPSFVDYRAIGSINSLVSVCSYDVVMSQCE